MGKLDTRTSNTWEFFLVTVHNPNRFMDVGVTIFKYDLTLCARCYVRGNYRAGINSSEFKRVEISAESKTEWSEKETLQLLEAVMHYGDDWKKVPLHVTARTDKDCVSQFLRLPFGEQFIKESDSRDGLESFDQIKEYTSPVSGGRNKLGSSPSNGCKHPNNGSDVKFFNIDCLVSLCANLVCQVFKMHGEN